jgi:hypothetical protein
VKKLLAPGAVAAVAGLVVVAAVQAATVTRATLPSSWDGYPMTCNETQLISGGKRTETFTCQYPGPVSFPARADETNATWFSDFDGAPAKKFNIVILQSGLFTGSATY